MKDTRDIVLHALSEGIHSSAEELLKQADISKDKVKEILEDTAGELVLLKVEGEGHEKEHLTNLKHLKAQVEMEVATVSIRLANAEKAVLQKVFMTAINVITHLA